MKESLSNKRLRISLSLCLTGLVVGLYFLDGSLACAVVGGRCLFLLPSFRGSYHKDKSFAEWFQTGFYVGISGICLLLAPYFALKYYVTA